jgi:FKBP-type peptidyl-prolyl cis-trans isomerase SlyD
MPIEKGCRVSLNVCLRDAQGAVIERTEEPIVYLHGAGDIFPRIESLLDGQGEGFRGSALLQPDEAFGEFDPQRVHLVAIADLAGDVTVDRQYEGLPGRPDGHTYIVTDVADGMAVLDGNHPLAGLALRFDVEVVAVEAAGDPGDTAFDPPDFLRVLDPHDLHAGDASGRH